MLKRKFEAVREMVLQQILLPKLKKTDEINRFHDVRNRYWEILTKLRSWAPSSELAVNPRYEWNKWAGHIAGSFKEGVPISFLSNSYLIETMVHHRKGGRKAALQRIAEVKAAFGVSLSTYLLKETYIGLPRITDSYWLTSANTAHHAFHLASYRKVTGKVFWESESIVEWGGGYGNMARILKKMNSHLTYTIIDLPELLALQYIYLYSTGGREAVHIIEPGQSAASGRVNFLPSNVLTSGQLRLECNAFISTWALTESPYKAQEYMIDSNLLSAEKVLLGYATEKDNMMRTHLGRLGLSERPVPVLPEGNAYAFR